VGIKGLVSLGKGARVGQGLAFRRWRGSRLPVLYEEKSQIRVPSESCSQWNFPSQIGRTRLFERIKPLIGVDALMKSDQNPHYPRDVMRFFPRYTHKTYNGRRGFVVGYGELNAADSIRSLVSITRVRKSEPTSTVFSGEPGTQQRKLSDWPHT